MATRKVVLNVTNETAGGPKITPHILDVIEERPDAVRVEQGGGWIDRALVTPVIPDGPCDGQIVCPGCHTDFWPSEITFTPRTSFTNPACPICGRELGDDDLGEELAEFFRTESLDDEQRSHGPHADHFRGRE